MIRKMKLKDFKMVQEIENESFSDARYTESQLKYEINENPFSMVLVSEENKVVNGFLIYMVTFNSATIIQIATSKNARKKGIATSLLNEMIKRLTNPYGQIENVTLEVRKNNKAAYNLYLKNKFKVVTIKKKYYTNGDDAIYMMRVLL